MADLEERVANLEREMSELKARVGDHDEDMQTIPDLIKTEFRLANSQMARLSRDVAELKDGHLDLVAKVDALPKVLAEMLTERDRRR